MTARPRAVRTLGPQPDPPGIWASKYDPAFGAALCRRLAAGESLRAICRADPAMPTEKTVWNWTRSHPEFALMKTHAMATARQAALAAQSEADAARRAARAAARKTPGRIVPVGGYATSIAEAICARLAEGETMQSVCADPDMPCVATAHNWMRRHPEFLAEYRLAKQVAADVLMGVACEDSPWTGSYAGSMRELARRERAAARRAGQLAPKRLAAREGPAVLRVRLEDEAGVRVIYGGQGVGGDVGSVRIDGKCQTT